MPTLIHVSRPSTRAERVDTNMTASATMPAANAAAPVKKNSNFQAIVKRLFQNRGAVIGLIIFIVLALAAIFALVAAPYGYEEMDLTNMLSSPSLEHLFGTDELGRDVFSRIIYGGRYSLSMLSAGRAYIRSYPHLIMFPGIFIMITVLGLNLFGDGLRDALDPKLKK